MRLADELGKRRKLMIVKKVEFGVYLGTEEERASLHFQDCICTSIIRQIYWEAFL
mgnify:CR=1 FL=1